MEREIGSAVRHCPDCGATVPVVTLPDGATTAGPCDHQVPTEVASDQVVVREYGDFEPDEASEFVESDEDD